MSETDKSEGELSYEAAREELVKVVQRLEAGGVSLAESLQLWERGEQLADTCQRWLDGARERVEKARAAREQQAAEAE
ncbi:exodeoxyribonuclease VII small subunit [Enemella dayhoffiae]|uniref:Exodeoxyribonuclease 7 small subunit n=1 Tax=Enemella dayhoffiae TaxID=2016507 RepID=A0A255GRD0_9ACTN|nr:exodeoxyribonuclease VII small subunit [Enemella dayhoffiae]OYO18141.1 exodeoxyribonuclease VII small subunit [Enemella dayhoffiae]